MVKSYDNVAKVYLTIMLRNVGFSERMIDMVWRLISNNWYSAIVNGKTFDFFFHSSIDLKEGDLLSL